MKSLKKLSSLLVIGILTLGLTGCDEQKLANIDTNNESQVVEEADENEKENEKETVKEDIELEEDEKKEDEEDNLDKEVSNGSDTEEVKKVEATIYYNSKEYIESGDESLDKFIPVKKELEVKDGKLAEAIILALYEEPTDKDLSTAFQAQNKFKNIKIKDGIAYVNFEADGMNGGSLQESLFIGQVVNSLLELENIKGVQFMIDDEIASDLMGHLITEEPFTEFIE